MSKFLSKFFYILADKKKNLFILILLALLSSVLDAIGIGLVGPFIALASSTEFIYKNFWLNWAYTQSGIQSENHFVLLAGLLIICIFCLKSFLSFNINHYIHKFSYKQEGELRSKLLHSYLVVPYTFHLNVNSAVLIHNIINETHMFCNQIMLPSLHLVTNVTIIFFILLLLLKINLVATVAILGIQLAIFFVYYLAKDKIVLWGQEKSMAQKEMIRIINHSLGGLKETRIVGCGDYFENQMHQQSRTFAHAASSFSVFKFLPRVLIEPLLITFLVGFIAVSLFSQNTQNLLVSLGIFTTASFRLKPVVGSLLTEFSQIRNANFSLNQLYFDLKNLEEQEKTSKYPELVHSLNEGNLVSSSSYGNQVMPFVNQIVLENVTYNYPNTSKTVLKDISLSLKKGQSIALIGKSGAGKTTLVDVILGLLIPESGDIKVDGISIYKDLRSWQNLIGYIPQSIFLIDDSIMKNIAFGVPDELIDVEKLNKAIQAAHLTELVEQLPDGVQTVIGERGVRLSGGQRQRIGIARALYHEREILVLDEATAALDSETESRVTEAIKSLSGTKTMIIIAHRLTTVQHCDVVYLIDKGRIEKSGSYHEVVL
jgi:ABC-type multidrug transport system fused ATPase/permease subunit